MKKKILVSLFCGLSLFSQAQVNNYCIHLTPEGQVDCGMMPELDGAKSYTLQFWLNVDQWTPNSTVLTRGNTLRVSLGKEQNVQFVLGNEMFTLADPSLTPNRWFQVTAIVEDGNAKVLLDGKQILERKGNYQLPQEDNEFFIGHEFAGKIDELRIWKNALKPDFDYFVHNTLNKWVPQLDDLVAYYKCDQEQCPHIVDYKDLFVPGNSFNHHATMSSVGVKRELVTDNQGLPYLLCGAYTNNSRFFDRAIAHDNYLLANDLIILGIDSYPDGHLKYTSPSDHASYDENVQYLESFEGRQGVVSFNGKGKLVTTTDVLSPVIDVNGKASQGYTFETWLYLDQWTPGAAIFKKMTAEGQGFSITLGEEETHQVIVNVNGNKYVNQSPLRVGKWTHFAVSTNQGSSPRLTFLFAYDGKAQWAKAALSTTSTDYTPKNNEDCKAIIGEGLCGKMDETVVWNEKYSVDAIRNHMNLIPFPAIGKVVTASVIDNGSAYYRYDKPEALGWDYFSQDEWKNIMLTPYKGYRGYQVRISVKSHPGWQNTIADARKRKIFAEDLAKLSEGYQGVELDLEWMDGVQTNLGKLAQEIRKVLPQDKTLCISCHAYGAYRFPLNDMKEVDGFTFQLYGPQKEWYNLASYKRSYNNFVNYGFPKDKIYMSYSTTTSAAYNQNDQKLGNIISGWRTILKNQDYVPSDDMNHRKGIINGTYYYYMSPEQVYQKAKFVVDNHAQGIFYWDMGNDVDASEKYSLAKYCTYALNSNVDSLVTHVDVLHPTAIERVESNKGKCQLQYNSADFRLTLEGVEQLKGLRIYTTDGRLVKNSNTDSVVLNNLPQGIYIVQPITTQGTLEGLIFRKRQ